MVQQTRKQIREILREEYNEVYEEKLKQFKPNAKIYRDLNANEPCSAFALEWRSRVAKRLGINENKLPKPSTEHDYTISELVSILKKA